MLVTEIVSRMLYLVTVWAKNYKHLLTSLTVVMYTILLTKITAAQNKVALNYHRVCGLYILAVVLTAIILLLE